MSEEKTHTEPEARHHFAAKLNGEVWGLLEKADRSRAEDEVMIHPAHASCCHWLKVGTGLHHLRAVPTPWLEIGQRPSSTCNSRKLRDKSLPMTRASSSSSVT